MGVVNHVAKVRRRTVSVCDARIVANNVDVDTVTLDLDSEWSGLSTVVAFGDGDDQVMVSVGVEPVEIPRSLTTASGYLPVTVIGYGSDGLPRMVTAAAPHAMIIVNSGVVPDQSYPEAPDLIGQLVTAGEMANEAADDANAAAGNANAAVDRANELAGKLGDIDAQVASARGSADAAADSAEQASASASAAQASEQNASNSATQASQSATAAKQSETNAAESERNAASSAEQAANIVASVSGSVSQAETAAQSASQSAAAAAGSASAAGGSAQAAADSASKAGESATAAKTSETNAASSASAAKISETNAAASATAAQQAADGFGLEVGTTTTGEPGTDAAVEIQKTGTRYTASFTIPRGDVGPAGVNENVPLGTASGVVAQASDAYPALPRKVRVHGATSGGNSVEPEKLTILGENLLDLSFIAGNRTAMVSGDEVVFKVDVDGRNDAYTWNDVTGNPYSGDTKYLIPAIPNSRLHFKAETSEPITSSSIIAFYGSAYNLVKTMIKPNVSGNIQSLDFDVPSGAAFISVRLGVRDAEQDTTITMRNICLSYADIEYVPPEKIETNLPSDISLANGDMLTIDRDGTTRIIHAEGEPTVLDNVTLPELPAPTFNVYTTGGYVPPNVDVGYEQDVNLVLQALAAKIASLEVNQTIIEGA